VRHPLRGAQRFHSGNHPIRGDPADDREDPVDSDLQVAAEHGRQQRTRLGQDLAQLATIQHPEHRRTVLGQRVDEHLAGGHVVVVTGRLTRDRLVIVTNDHRPQLRVQFRVGGLEHPTDA
jgi:hypothetical protein